LVLEANVNNRFVVAIALVAVIWQDCYARCISAPDVQAEVTVFECSKVTFENIRANHPPISGALLDVNVEKSEVAPGNPDFPAGKGPAPWKKGENRGLFVEGAADEICGRALALPWPHSLSVYAPFRCCDFGQCDVPLSITPVTIKSK
jgi:hypothetical protein